jgi:aconitase B
MRRYKLKNISPKKSIDLLGTMLGGYNVQSLVKLLETKFAEQAFLALSKITLIFDSFYDVETLHQAGNEFATKLMQSWAEAEWFNAKNNVPNILRELYSKLTVRQTPMIYLQHKRLFVELIFHYTHNPC